MDTLLRLLTLLAVIQLSLSGSGDRHKRARHRQLSAGGAIFKVNRRSGVISMWRDFNETGSATKRSHLSFWTAQKWDLLHADESRTDLAANFTDVNFEFGETKNGTMLFSDDLPALTLPFSVDFHFLRVQGSLSVAQESGAFTWGPKPDTSPIRLLSGQGLMILKFCHLHWHHLHKSLGNTLEIKFRVKPYPYLRIYAETGVHRFELGSPKATGAPYIEFLPQVLLRGNWTTAQHGFPSRQSGPDGQHLIALSIPLSRGCAAQAVILEPGQPAISSPHLKPHHVATTGGGTGTTSCDVINMAAMVAAIFSVLHFV